MFLCSFFYVDIIPRSKMKLLLSNIWFLILKITNFLQIRTQLRLSTILETSDKMVFEMVFQTVFVPTGVMAGNDPL